MPYILFRNRLGVPLLQERMPEFQTVVEDWGLIDYEQALERQLVWVARVQKDAYLQALIFCSHPPVATLGRKTKTDDIFAWDGPVVEVQRGGRVTYHGPNQIVGYPILNLNARERRGLKNRDLHGYLRLLENVLVQSLADFAIEAQSTPSSALLAQYKDVEPAGVWVGDRKLGSIGIGVKKWVTYHGFALNLYRDAKAFSGLRPCGFAPGIAVSAEEVLEKKIDRDEIKQRIESGLTSALC